MKKIQALKSRGFSLIEIIVAVAIMSILAAAVVPVVYKQIDQARYKRITQDLQSIYEAAMGKPQENYFGFVGDVGRLPDSIPQLISGTGQGAAWNGPYLSGVTATVKDPYGKAYVFDKSPIRVRSWGIDRTNNNGTGDDVFYPANSVGAFKGALDVQVYVNGRLIADAAQDQVTATLSYANNGTPSTMNLTFSTSQMVFLVDSIHQGVHVLTVTANKALVDPATTNKQLVTILPGSKTTVTVNMQDADYMTRNDTDLNGNGIPDRLEDSDGDGVPDDMDADLDGDGTPNDIDPDPLDPTVKDEAGGAGTAPIVNNVSPSYGRQGATNLLLTIDGAYFANGATLAFSGTGITVVDVPAAYVGASQLTARINISSTATIGLRTVTVTNPSGLAGTWTSKFEVLTASGTPSPAISTVTPNAVPQGSTGNNIIITGQNFVSGTNVTFTISGISVTASQFVSSTQINRTISVTTTAPISTGTVKVTNPDNKYAEAPFSVLALKPNISQISPTSANSGKQNTFVQLTGNNFLNGITATTSGSPLTIDQVQWQSATSMRVRVDCSFALTGVDRFIIVTNPGGAADSISFHINGLF